MFGHHVLGSFGIIPECYFEMRLPFVIGLYGQMAKLLIALCELEETELPHRRELGGAAVAPRHCRLERWEANGHLFVKIEEPNSQRIQYRCERCTRRSTGGHIQALEAQPCQGQRGRTSRILTLEGMEDLPGPPPSIRCLNCGASAAFIKMHKCKPLPATEDAEGKKKKRKSRAKPKVDGEENLRAAA